MKKVYLVLINIVIIILAVLTVVLITPSPNPTLAYYACLDDYAEKYCSENYNASVISFIVGGIGYDDIAYYCSYNSSAGGYDGLVKYLVDNNSINISTVCLNEKSAKESFEKSNNAVFWFFFVFIFIFIVLVLYVKSQIKE